MTLPENKPTQCAQGYDCDSCKGIEGMTLRDWFAGMALNAMLSEGFQPNCLRENYVNTADFNYFRAAYDAADAMIAVRNSPYAKGMS